MNIQNTELYPKLKYRKIADRSLRRGSLAFFVLAFLICAIVNLATGGKLWCLYVLGAEYLFWLIFIDKTLIEAGFVQKFPDIVISVCLYLMLVDLLSGNSGWASTLVVPIVFFSALIIMSFFYVIGLHKRKNDFIPLYFLVLGSVFSIVMGVVGLMRVRWPLIVQGCCAACVVVLSIVMYRKPIAKELKKKYFA